ncbi:hypothetical protein CFAM422_010838 [Trichoderma lentiforme]|uniref:Uncharacterized protein n=1 Tax=Trichoderma lentiforme TaxID=1567552 RepID=A0A9P4X516_9HYPO|nr:hypothetical protein CFAM422_010838 [Trichoderma lentiforme]
MGYESRPFQESLVTGQLGSSCEKTLSVIHSQCMTHTFFGVQYADDIAVVFEEFNISFTG